MKAKTGVPETEVVPEVVPETEALNEVVSEEDENLLTDDEEKKRKGLPEELYYKILKEHEETGTPYSKLCVKYDVSEATFSYKKWYKKKFAMMKEAKEQIKAELLKEEQHLKTPPEGSSSNDDKQRIKELEEKNKELEEEIVKLKVMYMDLLIKSGHK